MYQPLCGLEVGEDRKLPLSRHEVANVLEASQSPDSPLGLHAWKLLWEEHFTLVAPAPWDPPAC